MLGVTCVRLIDHGVNADWRTIGVSASYDTSVRVWSIRHGLNFALVMILL